MKTMRTSSIRCARRADRSGSTMVVVALLLAAVAMLSLSFLTVLRATHKESQGSRESLSALYACEAGLTRAVDDLMRGGTGALGSEQAPETFGNQRFWVEADALGDGRIALRSYGRDDAARVAVEMVVQPSKQGFFRWAAFGDEAMHLDANSRTDSYDSQAGTYDEQAVNGAGSNLFANSEGDVGSNQNITIDSNIGVYGDAHPGPGGSVTGAQLANIAGSTTPMPETIELPDIVVPTIASLGNLSVTVAWTLASGNYHYDSLVVENNKTLFVNGPATIVVGDFKLKSGADIVIDATSGPVEFFVLGDFILNSNTSIAATSEDPRAASFNLLSDNILDPGVDVIFAADVVEFDSNSRMFGTIYAPSAEIKIDSNFELFGSLVARRVGLHSNSRIHFDEQLAAASQAAESTYETLCWRLIALP
jgi:hypothetical protein